MKIISVHPLKPFIFNFLSKKGVTEKDFCINSKLNGQRLNKVKNGHWLLTATFAQEISDCFGIPILDLYKMELEYLKDRAKKTESILSEFNDNRKVA